MNGFCAEVFYLQTLHVCDSYLFMIYSAHEGFVKFSSLMFALIALSCGKLEEKYRGKLANEYPSLQC